MSRHDSAVPKTTGLPPEPAESAGLSTLSRASERVPPHVWFGVSAVFHYLGPSFAVLLFPSVGVLGVAWLRIGTAALLFALWTRPWRTFARSDRRAVAVLIALGGSLALMNVSFYLALERLPMSLVAAIEFVGTIGVALYGLRTGRNLLALLCTAGGVFLMIDVRWSTDPGGLAWAFLNAALFVAYIVLGHRVSQVGAGGGVQRLGAAMAVAFLFVMPVGLGEAGAALTKLPLLALLPASATVIGAIVLAQIPSVRELSGVLLVMAGVAIHEVSRG